MMSLQSLICNSFNSKNNRVANLEIKSKNKIKVRMFTHQY